MNGKTKTTLCLMLAMFGIIAFQPVAQAAYIELRFTDFGSSTTLIVDDGDTGILPGHGVDVNSQVGAVTFIGSIGVWNLNITSGITYDANNTTIFNPTLDLSSFNTSSAAGSLLFGVSAVDYQGSDSFRLSAGGTLGDGTLEFNSWIDTGGNALFGGSETLVPLFFDSVDGNAFKGEGFAQVPPDGGFATPYALTLTALLDHRGSGETSFDAELTAVPEPGSLILLGLGLFGLLGIGRKNNS